MPVRELISTIQSRRSFLKSTSVLGAGASLLGLAGWIKSVQAQQRGKITLDVQMAGGRQTYNGKFPGLTIVANPGDVLNVDLVNSLPPLHDDCADDINSFHGLNTTNLHTHGLHISPGHDSSGDYFADNVFVKVVPEGQIVSCTDICGPGGAALFREHRAEYKFEIPKDHPS